MNPNTKKIAAATLSLSIGASLLGSMSASADELSDIENVEVDLTIDNEESQIEGIDTIYDKFGTITEEEDVIAAPANDDKIYLVPESAEHSSTGQSVDLVEDIVEVDLTIDNEDSQIEDIDDNTDNIGTLDPNEEAVIPGEDDEGSYEIPVEVPVVEEAPVVEETPEVDVVAPIVDIVEDVVELPGGDTGFDDEDSQIGDIDDNNDNIGTLDPDEDVVAPGEDNDESYEIPEVETPVVEETPEVEAPEVDDVVETPVVEETPEADDVVELPGGDTGVDNEDSQIGDIDDNNDNIGTLDPDEEAVVPGEDDNESNEIPEVETPVVEETPEVDVEAPPAEDAPIIEDVDELPGGDTGFDNEDSQIGDIDDNNDNIGTLDPDEDVVAPGEDNDESYEIPEVETPVVEEAPEVEDVVETPVVEETPEADGVVELPGGDTGVDNEDSQIGDIDDNNDNIGTLDPDEEAVVPGEDDNESNEIPVETPVVEETPDVDAESPVSEDVVEDTPAVEGESPIVEVPSVDVDADQGIVTPTPVEPDNVSDAEIVEEEIVNAPVESEPSNLNTETTDAVTDEVVTVNDATSNIDTITAGSGANTDRKPTFNHIVDLSKVSADGSDYKDAMTFESEDLGASASAAVLMDVAESNTADASEVSESNESAAVTDETLPDTGVESNPLLQIAAGIALIAGGAMVLNARRRAKSKSEL